jgi:PTH1 family peptidyl-tRNA hydrolase
VSATNIRLVVGLGNPGDRYARTRHNAGWWFVEALARRHGGMFRAEPKLQSEMARVRVPAARGEAVELWLQKPTTFMNRSGAAVAAASNFYKIAPAEVLVVHDELDLPAGVARLKQGGGHGGHNGLRDTSAAIGADYWRLRLGIGHPGHKDQVLDYVLQRAGADDERAIGRAVDEALDALPVLLAEGAGKAMNQLHTRTAPAADASGQEG